MTTVAANCNILHFNPSKPPETTPSDRRTSPVLKRCSQLREFQQMHAQIIKTAQHRRTSLARLIEALTLSSPSHIDYARQVFDEMPDPSTFALNTMVRAYALSGAGADGIRLYASTRHPSAEPDSYTYPFLLKACDTLSEGKVVHSLIIKSGDTSVYSQTSLVTFYSASGDLECARRVFDKMQDKNLVSWTAMVAGYVQRKMNADGLSLIHSMRRLGIEPNEMMLVNVLSACANLRSFDMGEWVDDYIRRRGIVVNATLGTALVDMYAKCGHIIRALRVFDELPGKSIFTWNVAIAGLAMHGCGEEALDRFVEMQEPGVRPDDVTLLAVLSACSHSGMVREGKQFFYSMEREFGIKPNIRHYGCLVDLLGRASLVEEAYDVIQTMPMEPNGVIWGTLLN